MRRHRKVIILSALGALIVGIGAFYVMSWRRPGKRLTVTTAAAPKGISNRIAPKPRAAGSVLAPVDLPGIKQLDPSKVAFGSAAPAVIREAVMEFDRQLRKSDPHAAQDIPVINAALRGNVSKVGEYLDSGGNPNVAAPTSRQGNIITPLIAAISVGQREVIEELVARGADVNFNPGGFHSAPLVLAAAEGEQDVVRMLLNAGANINQIDGGGNTAIRAAVLGGNYSTVKFLLDQGAGVGSVLTPGGRLPAYVANSGKPNYVAIKKLLLARGALPYRPPGVNAGGN